MQKEGGGIFLFIAGQRPGRLTRQANRPPYSYKYSTDIDKNYRAFLLSDEQSHQKMLIGPN